MLLYEYYCKISNNIVKKQYTDGGQAPLKNRENPIRQYPGILRINFLYDGRSDNQKVGKLLSVV